MAPSAILLRMSLLEMPSHRESQSAFNWDALTALATVLGVMISAVAVGVTAWFAVRTLRAARDDSRERSRPIIVAAFERELLSAGTILLVVKNYGQSLAYEVVVQFYPQLPDPIGRPDSDMWKWVAERYATPIPTWAPGASRSNVVRTASEPLNPLTVYVSYRGPDNHPYTETYSLQPDHVIKATTSNPSPVKDPIKLAQQGVDALRAAIRTMRGY